MTYSGQIFSPDQGKQGNNNYELVPNTYIYTHIHVQTLWNVSKRHLRRNTTLTFFPQDSYKNADITYTHVWHLFISLPINHMWSWSNLNDTHMLAYNVTTDVVIVLVQWNMVCLLMMDTGVHYSHIKATTVRMQKHWACSVCQNKWETDSVVICSNIHNNISAVVFIYAYICTKHMHTTCTHKKCSYYKITTMTF
jgi:hypothetical protein